MENSKGARRPGSTVASRQIKMSTVFTKLSVGWNAEPNAPNPQVQIWEHDVVLSFHVNPFIYHQFKAEDIGQLRFRNCRRYRLGSVNDEGWYRGQCRFSKLAPTWGEFYEIRGDLLCQRSVKVYQAGRFKMYHL